MKILLFSTYRTGSYELLDWLSKELKLTPVIEIDVAEVNDNIVIKRTLDNVDFNVIDEHKKFDYTILLYRENTMLQAESNYYALKNQVWHDNKYEISKDEIIENSELINGFNRVFMNEKNMLKNLNINCLRITYEEIFIEGTGQSKIESYLNFKADKNLFNLDRKLRLDKNKIDGV